MVRRTLASSSPGRGPGQFHLPHGIAVASDGRVYVCERGHRTNSIWSTPTTCQAKPLRSGPVCGRQLYPIGELPEQVQKALNPLKASKKASKG